MRYTVQVSDTVTYARECRVIVDAESRDEAEAIALRRAVDGQYHSALNDGEEALESTPFTVKVVSPPRGPMGG